MRYEGHFLLIVTARFVEVLVLTANECPSIPDEKEGEQNAHITLKDPTVLGVPLLLTFGSVAKWWPAKRNPTLATWPSPAAPFASADARTSRARYLCS